MTTKKKRTGLDALGISTGISSIDTDTTKQKKASGSRRSAKAASPAAVKIASPIEKSVKEAKKSKDDIAKTTVYVPKVVFEQWRELAFTERKKMHDYLIEGLERVFEDRGLKSIDELTGKE
jgi:hypothetical protein